ncbi:MAG: DUF222 domain-containing protein [Actinobacteria bacterium]|nr:DUF222 domain-containing protein [Actinomycetota bacterium]
MLEQLREVVSSAKAIVAALDPASLHALDAVSLMDEFTALERIAVAGRTFLAARATDANEWSRRGYRTPEDWLANKTGTNWSQAKNCLDASVKLTELPAVDQALRAGKLSPAQLNEITPALTAENEQRLVKAAASDSARQLRQRCQHERAAQRSGEEELARYQRIHKERSFRSWIDPEGAWRCEAKTTADVGARIDAAIAAEAEKVFKAAHAEGRRDPAAAYRADALVNLIEGGGSTVDTVVVLRADATKIAGGEGMCQTADGADVPVEVVIGEILAGAFVKVVLTDGTDIMKVSHPGRHIPEELRTAVTERDGYRCVRPGCGSIHRLETHHYRIDYGKRGPTAYWNLATLCRHDHRLATNRGHRLDGGPGDWKWIEPP